jgi:hypothetical protein
MLACVVDEGEAIHYSALAPGTPIYSSDGVEVGKLEGVLDNYREHIFDGIVFVDGEGELRFADAPEVSRTAEKAVTLALTAEEARKLRPPDKGHANFVPRRTGKVGRFLGGGGWKRQR